ncbi:MAG: hydroxymethylbilane synthase [Methylacidiphilales bacterium]|nr:hydroxymethylbilane synthase [Candidatus Methylacidiphilales bacterium]
MKPLIIGSRGSALALAQSRSVMAELKRLWTGRNFEIQIFKTDGDRLVDQPAPGGHPMTKGLFTGELERALLDEKIDLAVHSLKDLPTEKSDGLMIAAIPKRADARDVIITRGPDLKQELRYHSLIATGSPRRASQLTLAWPHVKTVPIRGNVDTRLRKFRENAEWAGLILAAAGLERLKPDLSGLTITPLTFEQMLPAPGQGALALQTRTEHSADIRQLVQPLHDPVTAAAVTAERMFLEALGGGCSEPIAAYAQPMPGDLLRLDGIAWLIGETDSRRRHLIRRLDQAEKLGVDLAMEISQ